MKTPYWCTSVEHQYGGQKIDCSVNIWAYFGYLGDWLSVLKKSIYILSTFSNAQTSKRAQNDEISEFFSTTSCNLVSRTYIIRKFKMLWFPNEERYWAVKLHTDMSILPLLPDEDKNFGGSLVLDCGQWWRQSNLCYFILLTTKLTFCYNFTIVGHCIIEQTVYICLLLL